MDVAHIQRKVSTRVMSVENNEETQGMAGLKNAKRRGSINASISNHIMDMALKHEHAQGEDDHFVSKNRMLSGGFVVHPDAHHDDEHESHQIVKKAITKAARRVSHIDPLMGTHGSTSAGKNSSPFSMKSAPVMRAVGKIDHLDLSSSSRKLAEELSSSQRSLALSDEISSAPGSSPGADIRAKRSSMKQRKKSMSNLTLNLNERDLIRDLGEYSGTTPKNEKEKRAKRNSLGPL